MGARSVLATKPKTRTAPTAATTIREIRSSRPEGNASTSQTRKNVIGASASTPMLWATGDDKASRLVTVQKKPNAISSGPSGLQGRARRQASPAIT